MSTQPQSNLPPLSLTVAYFGAALLFLLAGSLGLVWVAPPVVEGLFPIARVVAVTHFFTLGWITLSILAALHHIAPTALGTQLMPVRCAWVQLGAFVVGLLLFVSGALLDHTAVQFAGTALVATALLLFAARLALAMLQATSRTRTHWALLIAAGFLIVVTAFGLLLAAHRVWGILGTRREPLLAMHAHLALVGWVLLVVVAVGQRLLPMFLLARAPDPVLGRTAIALVTAAALSLIAFSGAPAVLRIWVPYLLVVSGAAVFFALVTSAFLARGTDDLDPGMRLAGAGLVFLGIALLLAPFGLRFGWADPRAVTLYMSAAVIAGITIFIAGNYYRILPFLVWSRRVGGTPLASAVPAPSSLYRADTAAFSILLLALGAAVMLIGIARTEPDTARFGAITFATGSAIMAAQLLRVLLLPPVPAPKPGTVRLHANTGS